MRKAHLLSVVAAACAALAEAQSADPWAPPSCAEVETGSLEAELLDCDAAVAPATEGKAIEDLPQSGTEAEPVVEDEPDVEPAPLPEAEPVVVEEEPDIEPAPEPEVEPVVVIEEDVEVEPAPEVVAVEDEAAEDSLDAHPLEESVEPAEPEVVEAREGDGAGEGGALRIPNGHRPPPGSCRVWFPDRPPGHQPPPTSCDVEVPPGAVLIRG